jgi:3-(3-hydroxy-phenyl)propionate hydroxylase
MTELDCDVAVVGCGPVGVTLAGLLAGRGLRVIALDRLDDVYPLPRAAQLDHEIMRVLQELGIAESIAPSTIVNPGMDFLSADREVLLSMRAGTTTPSGWPASILFHQPGLEAAMRAAAVTAGAELRLGVEVASVNDTGDHALTVLGDGSTVSSEYVVACDGARSGVRKELGVGMDDLEFEEPWLVLDLMLDEGVAAPTDIVLQVCDPARPHTLVPMPAPRFRFEFMLLPGESAEAVSEPEQVRSMLSAWVDPGSVSVERSAVYTFHGLIASTWRAGRVLLAGDAAHQMPPFLGQGMCSGIRDAANLAWKLERVLRQGASDELLDTYQAEREPHVRAIVQAAVGFGRLICTTDVDVAAERDAGMLRARADGGGRMGGSPMPPLTPGPLVDAAGGGLAWQPMVDGARLDDVIGPRFAVIARSTEALEGAAVRWWASVGAALLSAETTPSVGAVLDALGADAVVIRPDRYVLAAGPAVPGPDESLAILLGTG